MDAKLVVSVPNLWFYATDSRLSYVYIFVIGRILYSTLFNSFPAVCIFFKKHVYSIT